MHLSTGDPRWPRWLELVGRVRDNIEGLVDEFMDRVRALPSYQSPMVPLHQVRTDASRIFAYLLKQMGDEIETESHAALAGRRLGTARARAGVPLGDLLAAVHLDSQVLWNSLRRYSRPDEQDLLIAAVEVVWAAVEDYSSSVQHGYAEEVARVNALSLTERTRLIAAMISSPGQTDEDARNLAEALGVETDARLGVVASERAYETEIRRVAQACAASRQVAHVHPHGDLNLLIVEHRGGDLTPLRGMLGRTPSVVAPITHGVRNLRRSCLVAIEAIDLGLAAEPRPVDLESQWLQLAAARAWRAFPEFSQAIHHQLDEIRRAEMERLVSTALLYASCGSIGETAERTYCHRNTVLTRLHRLRELTGYDMTVPAQAACLQLALLARPDFRSLAPSA